MTRRILDLEWPFDLARTVAPVWWGRGRWPNVDWRDGTLFWVGWEADSLVWRSVTQRGPSSLAVEASASAGSDRDWASRVLGVDAAMPEFTDPVLKTLSAMYAGLGMWAAGSLYEGFVSSVIGQSISVAAAAVTERRFCEIFHPGLDLAGRRFWPVPRPAQLAETDPQITRASGITSVRAAALREVGIAFADQAWGELTRGGPEIRSRAESLLRVRGIGRWTVESALLWGVGDSDAHPSGDVALLRAAKVHFPALASLADLDRHAEAWSPHRAWAARLLWLNLLGYASS